MNDTTTTTEARRIIEDETQRRGEAFLQARQRLEQEYNCTVAIVPK